MHNLEHLLFILSLRLRAADNEELADATLALASASHDYAPIPFANPEPEGPADADEALKEMNSDWSQRFLPPVTAYKTLYIIHDPGTGHLKIGQSNNPQRRLAHLQTATSQLLAIVHLHHGEDEREAIALESIVHRMLAANRVSGEWFNVTLDQAKAAIDQACVELLGVSSGEGAAGAASSGS